MLAAVRAPEIAMFERLVEGARECWVRMQNRAAAYVTAVFVTEEGVVWCHVDSSRYPGYVSNHGHQEIGHYNRFVDLSDLMADVLAAGKEQGLI